MHRHAGRESHQRKDRRPQNEGRHQPRMQFGPAALAGNVHRVSRLPTIHRADPLDLGARNAGGALQSLDPTCQTNDGEKCDQRASQSVGPRRQEMRSAPGLQRSCPPASPLAPSYAPNRKKSAEILSPKAPPSQRGNPADGPLSVASTPHRVAVDVAKKQLPRTARARRSSVDPPRSRPQMTQISADVRKDSLGMGRAKKATALVSLLRSSAKSADNPKLSKAMA